MNKNILIISVAVLGGMFLVSSVLAATTISFSPANVNVTSGGTFNMVVSVNPQEVKNYTVKTEIEFPADLLEIKSFSFGSNWMPLSQSGYDLIDNTNGLLIKTAGYPGGLSSIVTFGTISFSAKKDGTGTISAGNNSFALDATNQNLLSGTPQASVVITALAPTPTPIKTPSTPEEPEILTPAEDDTTPAEEDIEEEIIADVQPEQQPEEASSLLASIGNLASFGTGSVPIGIIVSIIVLLILFFVIKGIRLRKSK